MTATKWIQETFWLTDHPSQASYSPDGSRLFTTSWNETFAWKVLTGDRLVFYISKCKHNWQGRRMPLFSKPIYPFSDPQRAQLAIRRMHLFANQGDSEALSYLHRVRISLSVGRVLDS